MRRLSSSKAVHSFSPRNKPAYEVSDGERVIVETADAFGDQLKRPGAKFGDVELDSVNPATGPIAVRGAVPGEALCVSVEAIKCGPKGVLVVSHELGVLSKHVRHERTRVVDIRSGKAVFSDDLAIALNPHVGVVGVSPREGEFPSYFPGDFGGNLDTSELGEGAKVYLPVFVDGAMVCIGDVHAAMGDGEVCGCGIEVSAEVTVRLSRHPGMAISRPLIETPKAWITYAAAKTLDQAAEQATYDMVQLIMERRGTDFEDAYMLASVAAQLGISQVVDPLVAAKMSILKKYL